jgi:hypothetical protein
MTNVVQAEEIELTDAQLKAVCGAWDQGSDDAAAPDPTDDGTDDMAPADVAAPSVTGSDPLHILFFRKRKKLFILKKSEDIKFLHIG